MKDGARPSPFAASVFLNSKKVPIYCWMDSESFPDVGWRSPASNSRPSGDCLHHNQAALSTRLRRLSTLNISEQTLSHRKVGRTHGAPYRGYGYVPLRFWGNVVRRMGTQQQLIGKKEGGIVGSSVKLIYHNKYTHDQLLTDDDVNISMILGI